MPERTYPRHVHQRGGVYSEVSDEATYLEALALGWQDRPLPEWPVPLEYRAVDLTWTVPADRPRVGRPKGPKAPASAVTVS